MYLKINGSEEHYSVDRIEPFTTQHGKKAVRFIGDEIPETDAGFILYSDDDRMLSDLSDYVYLYNPNEYSTEEDEQILPTFTDAPIPESGLDKRLASMSRQIADLTPYEDVKTAYYGEKEKVFYGVPQGNVTVFFSNYNGEYTIKRIEDRLTISFDTLSAQTQITIVVQ